MRESPELRRSLELYQGLKRICDKARKDALANPADFAQKHDWPLEPRREKDDREFFKKFFDDLMIKIDEMCLVNLAATFEKIVFARLDSTGGDIKGVLDRGYGNDRPFFGARDKFVKTAVDFNNLRGAQEALCSAGMKQILIKDLRFVIDQRNRIAHGKRFGEEPETPPDLNDIEESLQQILDKHNLVS